MQHNCLRHRFPSGRSPAWAFQRGGEIVRIDPTGPLAVSTACAELQVGAACAGLGVVYLFEGWLRPALDEGRLLPVLEDWWISFPGPKLYFPSRKLLPGPLRAFVDFIKAEGRHRWDDAAPRQPVRSDD